MGAGASNTDALAFGGFDSPNNLTQTEHWEWKFLDRSFRFSKWQKKLSGTGTAPAAICAGGFDGQIALQQKNLQHHQDLQKLI